MAKYLYTLLPSSKSIYRPYLEIQLSNAKNHKQTPLIHGLLDSGADICLGSKDLAIWLGIQFNGREETVSIATATGTISYAVKKTVLLTVEDKQSRCDFFFADGIAPDDPLLLGHRGFFDHFKVCFDSKNKTFEVAST